MKNIIIHTLHKYTNENSAISVKGLNADQISYPLNYNIRDLFYNATRVSYSDI